MDKRLSVETVLSIEFSYPTLKILRLLLYLCLPEEPKPGEDKGMASDWREEVRDSILSATTHTRAIHGFVYRENHRSPGYYDGRYWTMWKLPMFGRTDPAQVLKELDEAVKESPNAFVCIKPAQC
ncbi:Ribulose bisphosphate carboxylase small chain 2 [Spatholobus suberectus]|nr:Ribulose bisphosphate carboxylase small chain 2 [Spatholobus suberectus]